VKEAVSLKVDIVLKDPWERGLRNLLNFGHSIGHALEVEAGYQGLSHGEAVALGMLIETKIAHHRGICSEAFEGQIKRILSFLSPSLSSPSSSSSSQPSSLSSLPSSLSFPPACAVHADRRKRESIFNYIQNINFNQLCETLTLDKKNIQGKMRFILPETLGKVTLVDDIIKEEVIKALEEFKKEWVLC
jgi:3-dehydroquinate synthase